LQTGGGVAMNVKSIYFSRFILLIAAFSSLLLLTGCPNYHPSCNSAYAKQAQTLAYDTKNLANAIQAVVEYSSLSEGWSDERILQHVYSERPEFGEIFSARKIHFTRVDNPVEVVIKVTVYADDQTTVLVTDDSSTTEIDYMYKCD
jgi:outer membrane murein-binding lipoprotein Lpp